MTQEMLQEWRSHEEVCGREEWVGNEIIVVFTPITMFCFCLFFIEVIYAKCDNFVPMDGEGKFEYQIATDETKSWFDSVRACKVNTI